MSGVDEVRAVTVPHGTPATAVALPDALRQPAGSAQLVTYEVIGDTRPGLFATPPVAHAPGSCWPASRRTPPARPT